MNRRKFLSVGAAVTAVGLSGCTDSLGMGGSAGGAGDAPDYATWIPREGATPEGEPLIHAHVDWEWLNEADEHSDEPSDDSDEPSDERVDDFIGEQAEPLFEGPIGGITMIAFGSFALMGSGIIGEEVGDVAYEDESALDDSEFINALSSIDVIGNTLRFSGEFDTDADIIDQIETFAVEDSYSGFDVYTYDGDEEDASIFSSENNAFAISDSDVIFGIPPQSETTDSSAESYIRAVIEAQDGDRARITEDDDAEWLLSTSGHGNAVVNLLEEDNEPEDAESLPEDEAPAQSNEGILDNFADPLTVSNSFTIDIENESSEANLSGTFPEGEAPTEEQLTDGLDLDSGNMEFSITTDEENDRVHIRAATPDGG